MKQFLGSSMQMLLFFVCTMLYFSLQGMENSCDWAMEQVIIPRHHLAQKKDYWQEYHRVGQDTLRTLAMINTAYNKIIEDKYRPDKKSIEQLMHENHTPIIRGQVLWNKDFNQCAWFVIGEPASVLKTLAITLVSLDDKKGEDKKDVVIAKGSWNNYMKPIIDDTLCLYFNKERAVCCYGYGWIKVSDHRNSDDFSEYSLTCSGLAAAKKCVVKVDNKGVECDLKEVFGIPAVMKAFLQSPYIYEYTDFGEIVKVHNLKDVIMPEEYKKFATSRYWYDCVARNTYCGC